MDPLSIAGSVAGLVSLADVVFRTAAKYRKEVKGSQKEVGDLLNEVKNMSLLLHNLSLIAYDLESSTVPGQARGPNLKLEHLNDCRNLLRRLESGLTGQKEDFELPSRLDRLQARLKWPFSASEMREMVESLRNQQRFINTSLTADSITQLTACLSLQQDTAGGVKDLQTTTSQILDVQTKIQLDERRDRVLEFFLRANPQSEFEMSKKLRHPLTGLWLTEGEDFHRWYNNPGARIWLNGIPGAGKSVIAGAIITECFLQNQSNPGRAVAYFYCTYRDSRTFSASNILSSVATQLARQDEKAYELLEAYYSELRVGDSLPKNPTTKGLRKILSTMSTLFNRVYIIIDGLDECDNEVEENVQCLLALARDSNMKKQVNIALLSRDEVFIRESLEIEFHVVELEAHTEDIQLYVASELEERIGSGRLRTKDMSLRGHIIAELVNRAKGMFRWVACQLDYMCELPTDGARRKALCQLPPTLPATYERILLKVDAHSEQVRSLVKNSLLLIACGGWGLETRMICEAASTSFNCTRLDADEIVEEQEILRWVGSLVRRSNDEDCFEFAHFTVQEFLEKICPSHPTLSAYSISEDKIDGYLASICLKYLTLDNFIQCDPQLTTENIWNLRQLSKSRPFYEFSAISWPIILHGGSYETDDNINFQLQALFHPRKTSQFCLWAIELVRHLYTRPIGELLEPHDDFFDDEEHATVSVSALLMPDFTPLHMSAALGFPQLTKHLINMGCSPNVTSRFGTPLHCAVGGLAVFSDSANVEDLEKFSYAMDHHTGKARRDTVQLLLNAGCSPIYRFQSDFRSSGVLGLSAIYSPFELDGFEIIIDLLRARAIVEDDDLEVFSVTYDRFLEWSEAEERRRLHDGLLKDLIQVLGAPTVDDGARFELFSMTVQFVAKMKDTITGEIPQEVSIEEQNAFSVSSIIRNNDVSRLGQYLKGGNLDWLETAIPDDKGEGLKPIHLATLERSLDVLGLILESGCNVNSFMDDGGTAASLCWEDKYGECLKLLLKYGASTTIKKGDGTCLWHDAAIEDSGIIMKILVQSEQRDQGLRTISSEGQTPICAAISASNLGSALVMLPYCNKKECWNSNTSIFRDVTKLGWPIILKKLVEVDVDLDGMDNEGSPLHFLPKYPDQECVSLLSSLFDPNQRSPSNQRLPFEHYISRTLGQGTYANPEIYKILLPQEALIQTTESCCHIWTNICEIVALPGNTSEVGISWGSEVLEYLISTKILEIFETERRSSGVILLCDAFLRALAQPDFEAEPQNGCICIDETFGILSDTYWDYFSAMFMVVIEQTTLSRAIVANPTILTAFKHAIAQNDLPLVRLLLRNGAELHTEVDGLSAFEIACMASLSNDVFSCIIEHSQADHLQKANKARRGCGPLHYCHSQGRLSQHEKSIRMRNLRRLLQNIEDCDIPNSEQGGTPLFYHVVRGSISTAEVLVEAGANPWITCASNGLNSVMAAVDQGFTWGTIEILTQNETYPPQWKHTLKHGETVLHIAAAVGNCDCLEVLLDKGIAGHSHTLDKYDRTPMHHAAARGRTEAVRILAQRGGDVNLKTIEGFTPLHFAAKIGHPSIVKVLLELGAKQFECSDGCTPLVYAYTVGNPDVIEMLTTGANIVQSAGLITKPKALLALTKALRDAVMNDDLIACKRLKNLGCPLHIELEISGQCMTPLMLAMSQGKSPTLINWFIENGPLVSIGNRFPINGHYFCVLDVAIMNPLYVGFLPKLMNAFVAEGGDLLSLPHNILFGAIDYRAHGALNILLEEDFKGLTTMNKLAFTCHPEKLSHEARSAIIRLVNKRETESYQESPLIKAISLGAVNAVELLIQAGADADLVSTYGYTALHHATLKGSVDMVQLILDSGCLVNVQNMWQTKAIDFAFSYGNLAIARLLTQAGAHVTTESIMLFGHRRSLAHLFNSDNFWASRSLDLQDPLHIPITMSSREISNITANIPVLRRHMGDAKLSTVLHFHSSGKHSILCQATMLGLMQAVERLVRFGADINHLCEDHGTVLTVAVRFQRFELFRYLFRHGASIDHSSKQLSNVLSNATSMVHPIILDWVLVTRHTERRRITYEQLDMGENITGRWAGVKTAAIGMKWEWGKRRSQSSFEYACRLHDIKRSLRGRVVSPLEVKL